MSFDDLPGDEETKSRTLDAAGRSAIELLEEARENFRRDTSARILDRGLHDVRTWLKEDRSLLLPPEFRKKHKVA